MSAKTKFVQTALGLLFLGQLGCSGIEGLVDGQPVRFSTPSSGSVPNQIDSLPSSEGSPTSRQLKLEECGLSDDQYIDKVISEITRHNAHLEALVAAGSGAEKEDVDPTFPAVDPTLPLDPRSQGLLQ